MLTAASISDMKSKDISSIDRDTLVDIRDVKVNTALPKRERALDFIRQIGNPYCYNMGNTLFWSAFPTRTFLWRTVSPDTSVPRSDILDKYGTDDIK